MQALGLWAVLVMLNVADVALTAHANSHGVAEGNPLLVGLSLADVSILKAGLLIVLLYGVALVPRSRWLINGLILAVGVYSYVIAYHLWNLYPGG